MSENISRREFVVSLHKDALLYADRIYLPIVVLSAYISVVTQVMRTHFVAGGELISSRTEENY